MKVYETDKIRNIAIIGHLGTGKTSLTESILLASGTKDSKGEVDKNSKRQTKKNPNYAEEQEKVQNRCSVILFILGIAFWFIMLNA